MLQSNVAATLIKNQIFWSGSDVPICELAGRRVETLRVVDALSFKRVPHTSSGGGTTGTFSVARRLTSLWRGCMCGEEKGRAATMMSNQ